MPQPSDALDLRRAPESVVLDALGDRHPLALAEAYHRTVPAAHAVARRLMSGADDVEDLLLAAYAQLWEAPPATGPLEGWIRRTVWTLGLDRLRDAGAAPASPSLAGLVPDLPAPDVRFLDAAERAIAELPDEQRRALLLAHDKGVPTSGQEPDAAEALVGALLALAGPETSAADRTAMDEDDCADVPALGDWCLGVASSREEGEVAEALDSRPACAAVSRAARRGRRRIEGLPATPDMGQRVLVSVLMAGGLPASGAGGGMAAGAASRLDPSAGSDVDADAPVGQDVAGPDVAGQDVLAQPDADPLAAASVVPVAGDPFLSLDETGPLQPVDAAEDPFAPAADAADPFADATPVEGAGVLDTADLPGAEDHADDEPAAGVADGRPVEQDPFAPSDDPFAPSDGGTEGQQAEGDRDWRPDPGSTAEMRLSDILAEGEDDEDDPFAALDDDADAGAPAGTGNPYAALRDLDDAPPTPLPGDSTMTLPATGRIGEPADDGELVGGYVEGQEDELLGAGRPSALASVLAWVLPILGGTALGILVAITVFGLPS